MVAPVLRFKEFDDSWDLKKLDQIAEVNPKTKELPSSFFYIDLESVSEGLLIQRKKIDINEAPSRAQRLLEKSDVLFQMVRPYQQNNFYFDLDGDYVASTGYAQIRTKLNSKYIYYVLHSKKILDEVINRCTGTSYPAINSSELSGIEVAFPSIREQTKIASFFSAVDEKINQLTQKHQLLSQYKQGMMQKLFSQKMRFKADDGSEFSEWKTLKFKYFIQERNQICSDATVELCSLTIEKGVTEKTERYTRDFLVKDEKNAYKEVHFNDFVMNPMNLRFGAIAKSNMDKIVKISKYYNVFNINQNIVNLDYFVYFSVSKPIIDFYNLMSTGSLIEKRRNHFKDFIQYEKSFPCLEEQTKIANFLSAIDQKIEVVAQQIEQAKQWKKGLLQQMFV